jgi:hypothetical protein
MQWHMWESLLSEYPDQNAKSRLQTLMTTGARLEREGKVPSSRREPPDRINTKEAEEVVDAYTAKELSLGRFEVFNTRPKGLVLSPFSVVFKDQAPPAKPKGRFVFDLSNEDDEGISVNSGIVKRTLQYESVDSAVNKLLDMRKVVGTQKIVLIKMDVRAAFRCVPIDVRDHHLLGFKWRLRYYIDKFCSFGSRSSPQTWEDIAAALHWLLQRRLDALGLAAVVHYVDDFLIMCSPELAAQVMAVAEALGTELGIPWEPTKTLGPATKLPFLGVDVDTESMTTSLPADKATKGIALVASALQARRLSRAKFESLAGTLSSYAQSVRNARTFCRRLYQWLADTRGERRARAFSQEVLSDLQWWAAALPVVQTLTVPMHCAEWAKGSFASMHTDASTSWGGGATLCRPGHRTLRWWQKVWSQEERRLASRESVESINWLEAATVLIGVRTWAEHLRGLRLWVRSDNTTTVSALRDGYSTCPHLMHLVRSVWLLSTQFCIELRVTHIPGAANVLPDALSRGETLQFGTLARRMARAVTTPFSRVAKVGAEPDVPQSYQSLV